jgi:hypothetical protein
MIGGDKKGNARAVAGMALMNRLLRYARNDVETERCRNSDYFLNTL